MSSASQQPRDAVTTGITTRPPLLYLACVLLGLALERVLPLPRDMPATALMRWVAGGGLIVIGVAIVSAGVRGFSL